MSPIADADRSRDGFIKFDLESESAIGGAAAAAATAVGSKLEPARLFAVELRGIDGLDSLGL